MREIKFRGKRIDNGEFICGKLLRISETNQHFISPISSNIYDGEKISGLIKKFDGQFMIIETVEVFPKTAGQFTGLLDKNGVEIYEGDIVDMHYFFGNAYAPDYGVFEDESNVIGVVGINEIGTYTETEDEKHFWLIYLQEPEEELKVLGNIHENPELLEVEK